MVIVHNERIIGGRDDRDDRLVSAMFTTITIHHYTEHRKFVAGLMCDTFDYQCNLKLIVW